MAFNNVPVNGWPQIKELEKLDELAKQIDNMPTFTSNDRAFLADLPAYPDTDGTKVLTATTYDGDTSLSYDDIPEELPADPQSDGIRVLTATTSGGETVKSWEAMQGNKDYSTSEQATGQKWIDGKDIYFRVITTPVSIAANDTWYSSGFTGIDTIVNYIVSMTRDGEHIGDSFNTGIINYANRNNEILIKGSGFTLADNYVVVKQILYYTKVTPAE